MEEFEEAGIAVFAMSYDPADVLRSFALEQGISYDLLSDQDSAFIRKLGLLNEHIEDQQSYYGRQTDERHVGIPYPGTFVLDATGVVIDRIFEQSYRTRPSAGHLFKKVAGAPPHAVRSATSEVGPVAITAWLDSPHFRPLELCELHVQIEIAEGWHLYTEPVPDGFRHLSVVLEADAEHISWPADIPIGERFRVEGLPNEFHVVEGALTVSVPFRLPGSSLQLDGRPLPIPGEARPVSLSVDVNYQACSATECTPPASQTLQLEIDEARHIEPST